MAKKEKGSRAKKDGANKTPKKESSKKKDSKPAESVDVLLKKLEKSDDKSEKRALRIQLRKAGHTGGLRVAK